MSVEIADAGHTFGVGHPFSGVSDEFADVTDRIARFALEVAR